MNQKKMMIIEEFRMQRAEYVCLGDIASAKLKELISGADISIMATEHRVKEEDSLARKLERKGDKYTSLSDLTDILGIRVICFYNDDVDRIGKLMEENFVVDWENSVDKRALIQATSFGYLSLHYICSLPEGQGYPEELCSKKFEVQVRTNLQHTWACIEHDMGYKSKFGVPRIVRRRYARIAGLLEMADEEFARVRDESIAYTEEIRLMITENRADNVPIDMISLKEYVSLNKPMRSFLESLAAICNAEISETDPGNYIEQLRWLGKNTIGDIQDMLEKNQAAAYALAEKVLENSEIDILSSGVGLRFLCRAELLNKGYTYEQIVEFLRITIVNEARAQRMAESLLKSFEEAAHK